MAETADDDLPGVVAFDFDRPISAGFRRINKNTTAIATECAEVGSSGLAKPTWVVDLDERGDGS